MGVLRDLNGALTADKKVEKLLQFLTDNKFKDLKKNFYFYKIRGEVENGKLKVEMYFHHREKWYFIGEIDLNNNKITKHIDKQLFKILLDDENNFLIEKYHREMHRSMSIILSLLALILGILTTFILINLIK